MTKPENIMIRACRADDADSITKLHQQNYEKEYGFKKTFAYYVKQALDIFLENPDGGEIWIIEKDGQVAGSLGICRASASLAQLRWFIIDESCRRNGLGRELLTMALAFCKTQGYSQVFLWTVDILAPARRLYQQFGFSLTETKQNRDWTERTLTEERWDLNLV